MFFGFQIPSKLIVGSYLDLQKPQKILSSTYTSENFWEESPSGWIFFNLMEQKELKPDFATPDITRLLVEWGGGDQAALDELMPVVHAELQKLAHSYMRRENSAHTLQTTALVNEAYLRLIDQKSVQWQSRAHFFGIAAQMMRRILIDHARSHEYAKRGGKAAKISLDDVAEISDEKATEMIALDEALTELAKIDARRGRVVELRYFGGLSNDEIAAVLQISVNTVLRDWNLAKAWLHRTLTNKTPETP